jgi:hypothetical protein
LRDNDQHRQFVLSQLLFPTFLISMGEKQKAHDILDAIRTLMQIETEQRLAKPEEQDTLRKFPGFGAVALRLFPDPVTGQYKDDSWKALGEELQSLLTPEEYRQRQAHHLHRLLHLAHSHAGHARCLGTAWPSP